MTPLHCGHCGALRETEDNFCRRCGHQLTVDVPALPAVRRAALPVRQQRVPNPVVSSVAVLALGTGIEWLARRLAGPAARAAGRALIERQAPRARSGEYERSGAIIDEVLYVRKVQLRR